MIIDADSHICERPDTWTSRLSSAKWGDLIPHVRHNAENNSDMWYVGDHVVSELAMTVMFTGEDGLPHRREDDFPMFPRLVADVHPSSWDASERAKVMNRFGLNAAALYPNVGLTTPDRYRTIPGATLEFQVEVLEAYNDYVLSWAQEEPGRFIPLAVIPYWDIASCVKEVERCAALGHKGFVMSGTPEYHDSPVLADRHWDPLWSAVQASGQPIAFHAGSSGEISQNLGAARLLDDNGNARKTPQEMRRAADGHEVHMVKSICTFLLENAIATVHLLMSGVLPRYPGLNFAIVETGTGWVPFVLETLDVHYTKYRPWRNRPEFMEDVLPSEYFNRQVFVNNWYERLRKDDLGYIPIGNVMFETDYPHPTCLLGEEITHALDTNLSILGTEDYEKVVAGNALRCFNLKPADVGEIPAGTTEFVTSTRRA